ncbi:MAG: hypothetical protein GXP24_02270 [Planctomycetes bacterium]|nr:hypothetical protein [Planctomycetota bacterium]
MYASLKSTVWQFFYGVVALTLAVSPVLAQSDINQPPINYSTAPVNDAIARLQQQIDSGEIKLEWDKQHGWLPSVLDLLKIPRSSQLLVFSKTSLQLAKISPRTPRVLYFNDEVYIGSVQSGAVLEVSAVDSQQGAIFYALDQKPSDTPKFRRSDNDCLTCHQNRRTQDVPGYLVRSVYPGKSGHPHFELGTTTTDQTTDFHDRFGGWYVTGKHGKLRHRGNMIASKNAHPPIDPELGANVTDLASRLNTDHYLTKHSDMVALMVLEHQAQMHNFITHANYEARQTKYYDATWNKVLNRPEGHRSEVSQRRLASASEKLLRYLLFSGEFRLTSPIEGTSDFAAEFESIGPHDSQGRSLRQFDLNTRLFKYPCSFLIYGDAFAALPDNIREVIDGRLQEILSGEDQSPEFAHLSPEDRTAIREILEETLPGFLKP